MLRRHAPLALALTLTSPLMVFACAGGRTIADEEAPAEPREPARPREQPARAEPPSTAGEENDPRWHDRLRAVAGVYESWGRVDDEFRWAPGLCRMPTPAQARLSEAEEDSPHGRKLYTLYAKDPAAYGAPAGLIAVKPAPALDDCEQVVVKEAWRPQLIEASGQGAPFGAHQLRPARRGDKLYGPGDRAGLYVMFKLPDETPGTDRGWVYGTIAADRETVTAAGRVESCMGCHEAAPRGRLFGLPQSAYGGAWSPNPPPSSNR